MGNLVVFGGTFNPIHSGHIEIIEKALSLYSTEKILVIPTSLPPHKISIDLASDADRFEMCKLATQEFENVEVSNIELVRGGKSYTFDTLNQIKKLYPDNNISIICGGDMVVTFNEWYRYKDILNLAEIIAVRRVGIDNSAFNKSVCDLINLGGRIQVLEGEISEISSTEIRENLNNTEYLNRFLPPKVCNYILENNLYSGE